VAYLRASADETGHITQVGDIREEKMVDLVAYLGGEIEKDGIALKLTMYRNDLGFCSTGIGTGVRCDSEILKETVVTVSVIDASPQLPSETRLQLTSRIRRIDR
jgi:hypothetical protein